MSVLNKYYELQNIIKYNVNQVKQDSMLFIFSSACLSVTFTHQDQQRDCLTVVPSSTYL